MTGEQLLQAIRDAGGKASTGPIANFRGGWARMLGTGERTHYWRAHRATPDVLCRFGRGRAWVSLCHVIGVTTDKAGAFGQGNFERCKHCQRQANKQRLA